MGESRSAKVIVGCVIYFFFFFIAVAAFTSIVSWTTYSQSDYGYNDAGIVNQTNIYTNKPHCVGEGRFMNFLGNIKCESLDISQSSNETCLGIDGCGWQNYTDIFGIAVSDPQCINNVNLTSENISNTIDDYCQSVGLQTIDRCHIFGCNWVYPNVTANIQVRLSDRVSVSDIWNNILSIVAFRFDFGLESYNAIVSVMFSFFFFYLETLILLISIYFALPFLH